jgi:hypothetical protein
MAKQKPSHWAQSCSSRITQGLPCLVYEQVKTATLVAVFLCHHVPVLGITAEYMS